MRRVGTVLEHYGIEFEHRPLRAGGEEQDIVRQSSPLGRVPVLILDNGDVLSDSALILDYLDTQAPPDARLMPGAGEEDRFRFLNALSIATGTAEKSISVYSELAPAGGTAPPAGAGQCVPPDEGRARVAGRRGWQGRGCGARR